MLGEVLIDLMAPENSTFAPACVQDLDKQLK
jgi:hypothetical protein